MTKGGGKGRLAKRGNKTTKGNGMVGVDDDRLFDSDDNIFGVNTLYILQAKSSN